VVLVVNVRVEDPEPATDAGLKVAEALPGRPLALKVTVPVNAPSGAIVTV
jgi:hypothetical protein